MLHPWWTHARSHPADTCSQQSSCRGWKFWTISLAMQRPAAATHLLCAQDLADPEADQGSTRTPRDGSVMGGPWGQSWACHGRAVGRFLCAALMRGRRQRGNCSAAILSTSSLIRPPPLAGRLQSSRAENGPRPRRARSPLRGVKGWPTRDCRGRVASLQAFGDHCGSWVSRGAQGGP